jgi:urease accessory protein
MLKINRRIAHGTPSATLTLPLEMRVRARFRARLDDGREVGLFLDRGPIMRGGDRLLAEDESVVEVIAAAEAVSVVKSNDPHLLARACYHLGNRHTPLQILQAELRYQHDHVLDELLRGLGLEPVVDQLPFEPEPGAYGEHGSDHAHGHSHVHRHDHAH